MTRPNPAALARLHSLLGMLLLGLVCAHLWVQWPALQSRDAWGDRALGDSMRDVALGLVVATLLGHVALGALRVRTRSGASAEQRGLARVQAVSGALVLAFVAYHVAQVWVSTGPHVGADQAYAVLWQTSGRPLQLVVYLVGLSALSFHLGHGLGRAAQTWGLARTPRAIAAARWTGGIVGLGMWLAQLQLLAHFALGTSLWPS